LRPSLSEESELANEQARGEQREQSFRVAALEGVEEALRELFALLARRLDARPALIDMSACPRGKLPAVLFALPDDCCDLGVVVAEDVVKEEDRSLNRRERSSKTRNAREGESAVSVCSAVPGMGSSRSGSGTQALPLQS
jgi:hypothetical protein